MLPTVVATPKLVRAFADQLVPFELKTYPAVPGAINPMLAPPTIKALLVKLEAPVPPLAMGRMLLTLVLRSIFPANMPLVIFEFPIVVTPVLFMVTSPERFLSTAALLLFPMSTFPSFKIVPAKVVLDSGISATAVIRPLGSTVI